MRRRNGYTLIELALVLMLLILVAIVVFTLASSGSQTYLRLTAKQSQAADLRTGLSYLDVQVRKHDTQDALAIRPDPFGKQPALVVEQQIEGKTFQTWIYLYDGYLCELFAEKGIKLTPNMGNRIAPMDELTMQALGNDALQVTLTRQAEGQARIQGTRIIHLYAGGISP